MQRSINTSQLNQSAPTRGGHFPVILLPPLAVIIIGIIFGLLTSGFVIKDSATASSGNNDLDPATMKVSAAINENMAGERLSDLFTPEVLYWKDRIMEWAHLTNLDPNLVATVMQIESCGDPLAESHAGARGLFQVMPFHFESSEDPFDPDTSALRGLIYLGKSFNAADTDISLTLAGYNGGISVIWKSVDFWADETRRYVYWGSGIYQDAINGSHDSPRLQEWLSHGGASLCRQASDRLGMTP